MCWQLVCVNVLQVIGDIFGVVLECVCVYVVLIGKVCSDNQQVIVSLFGILDDVILWVRVVVLLVNELLYNFVGCVLIVCGLLLLCLFDCDGVSQFDISKCLSVMFDGYCLLVKMVVLLLFSGCLVIVVQLVCDGLFSGYYGELCCCLEIQFIDIVGIVVGVVVVYDKVVGVGVDFIVGLLGCDEVDVVFGCVQLLVLVLVLNCGKGSLLVGSVGFLMVFEDDGIIVVEYLCGCECGKVLVVYSNDEIGCCVVVVFCECFIQCGGQVVVMVGVNDIVGDVGVQLCVVGSVDGVFLVVKVLQVCMLVLQLVLVGVGGVSCVGILQLIFGSGKFEEDMVLDGIIYLNEVWNVCGVVGLLVVFIVGQILFLVCGVFGCLFVFGFDVWKISVYLDKIVIEGVLVGVIGILFFDSNGNVLCVLVWLIFSGGWLMLIVLVNQVWYGYWMCVVWCGGGSGGLGVFVLCWFVVVGC